MDSSSHTHIPLQRPLGEQIELPPPQAAPPSSDSHRFIPTPFLTKTYHLVEDASINSIISWNEDGTGFVVWNPAEFARDVLPKYFKHNNFSSFVRQLNTYGFRKVMPDRWEFSNDCFRKGDKRLLCDIVRRKLISAGASCGSGHTAGASSLLTGSTAPMEPSTSNSGEGVFSSNSTPSAAPAGTLFMIDQGNCNSNNGCNNKKKNDGGGSSSSSRANLMDENDRLKKENTQLCKELSQMKSMCTNIYSMMSNYNPGSGPVPGVGQAGPGPPMLSAGGCGSSNSSQAESVINPLHLLSGQRLLAAVVETRAAKALAALVVPGRDELSVNRRLFGFQLGAKRARGNDREDPMERDDLLQLQQPGSSDSK